MLNDFISKDVTIFLALSALGCSEVKGKILEVSEDWIKVERR